jgi:hypothetical protein
VLDDGRILTVEKAISRIKIYREGQLDCVVAGSGTLEAIPPESGRTPQKPEQRFFAVAVLSDGRIAIFDFVYRTIRIFAPIDASALSKNNDKKPTEMPSFSIQSAIFE